MEAHRAPGRGLVLASLALLAGTLALSLRAEAVSPWGLVLCELLLFVPYWLAVRSVWKRPRGLFFILLVAVALRLAAIPGAPLFENDFYRYIWEGRVLRHGGDPYAHAPDSNLFWNLRDDVWVHVGYDQVPSCYPPLALAFFALVGPAGLYGLKAIFCLAEVGIVVLLLLRLRARGQPSERVILYAWCPLPLKEVAGSAHYDPVVVLLVLLALHFSDRPGDSTRESLPALAAYAAACAMKLYPLFLAPCLFGRRALRAWAVAGVVLVLVYLPFLLDCGLKTFRGLLMYMHLWLFNPSVFGLVEALLGRPAAEALGGALTLAAIGFCLIHRRAFDGPSRYKEGACVLVLLTYLMASHVLDPWYLLWVLPLLTFEPFWWAILLVALVPLSYTYWYHQSIALWPTVAEYVPVYSALAWDLCRREGQVRSLLRRIRQV